MSRPSLTAMAVAAGRAVGAGDARDDLAVTALPPFARPPVQALQALQAMPLGDRVVAGLTAGLTLHASCRMAAIDEQVREAVAAGIAQVVIVGAGLDTRAWRLVELRDVHLIEVDLAATQEGKQRALRGESPQTPVTFVPADLSREPLVPRLVEVGWQSESPTLWLWEAVAPYLPDQAVRATARGMAESSAPGSRLVMTYTRPLGEGPLGGVLAAITGAGFRAIGEPILSTYDDWDMCALLEDAGFSDPVLSGYAVWARLAGVTPRSQPFAAERLVVATVS